MSAITNILELEKYIPFMESEELKQFEDALFSGNNPNFNSKTISKWHNKALQKEKELNRKFTLAKNKSNIICKQLTAKK